MSGTGGDASETFDVPAAQRARLITGLPPLGALALLIANDVYGKGTWPGWFTGKASDFAGLFVAPLVLTWFAAAAIPRLRQPTAIRYVLGATCMAGAAGLIIVKTVPAASQGYEIVVGAMNWPVRSLRSMVMGDGLAPYARAVVVTDLTDLLALPAAAAAWWYGTVVLRPATPRSAEEPVTASSESMPSPS